MFKYRINTSFITETLVYSRLTPLKKSVALYLLIHQYPIHSTNLNNMADESPNLNVAAADAAAADTHDRNAVRPVSPPNGGRNVITQAYSQSPDKSPGNKSHGDKSSSNSNKSGDDDMDEEENEEGMLMKRKMSKRRLKNRKIQLQKPRKMPWR
jgi:hypothetical protein